MQKLRVFESISIDGFFADARGDIRWAHERGEDPAFRAWVASNASGSGTLLFGRVTYQMMEAFWPTPDAAKQMPEVAKGMNAANKVVVSRTIHPTWANTNLLKGDLAAGVRALKETPGPGITVLGSGNLVAQLDEAGLVDEVQLVVIPIALGAGRSLFARKRMLRLVDSRTFECGNVVLTYAVDR